MQLNRLVILWGITIIGMILHFNYHVGELFYGVDIVKPGYDGEVPFSVFIIRSLFYILPIVWILLLTYFQNKILKLFLFVTSILYSLAHLGHLIGEFNHEHKDPSQLLLLVLVFVVSCLIVVEQYKYWKSNK